VAEPPPDALRVQLPGTDILIRPDNPPRESQLHPAPCLKEIAVPVQDTRRNPQKRADSSSVAHGLRPAPHPWSQSPATSEWT